MRDYQLKISQLHLADFRKIWPKVSELIRDGTAVRSAIPTCCRCHIQARRQVSVEAGPQLGGQQGNRFPRNFQKHA